MIGYNDYMKCGGEKEAKTNGKMRQGKIVFLGNTLLINLQKDQIMWYKMAM